MFEEENLTKENLPEKKVEEKVEEVKIGGEHLEIRTMPEKFLHSEEKKRHSFIFIVSGLLVVVILAIGGLYLFKIKMEKNNQISLVNLNTSPSMVNTVPVNGNVNTVSSFISKPKTIRAQTFNKQGELISSAKLFFPQGALKSDFEITLTAELPEKPLDPRFREVGGVYTFLPEQIELLKPATLIFVYKEGLVDKDLEKELKAAVLKDGFWEVLDGQIDLENKMISVNLDQFSSNKYALVIPGNVSAGKEEEILNKESLLKIFVPSTLDSDKDGLTDEEERIYQTKINDPDTDRDTYPDGLEIVNLYSPLAGPGVRLSVSGLINTYTNPVYNYSIFYPSSFLAKALEGTENREVMFTSPTSEFMEIIVQDNPQKLSARDWYLEQSPGIDSSAVKQVQINGKDAVLSPDNQTIYITDRDKVYVITYSFGARKNLSFKSTFEMMIKSFQIVERAISFDELKSRGQDVTLDDLKKDPAKYYGKEIVVRGYVKEFKEFANFKGERMVRDCPCFALTSIKTSKEYITDPNKALESAWYDMMMKEDGTPLPAVDVSGIKNSDLVDVFGEFKAKEEYAAAGDLWVEALKKL